MIHTEELSGSLKNKLLPDFAAYGLSLTQMLVTAIVKPEGDPIYEKFKDLHFKQYADVREAQIKAASQRYRTRNRGAANRNLRKARAEKRQIEGYTYQQERSFDVAEKMAQNEAVGEYANMGIGLGVMAGVGGTMGSVMTDALTSDQHVLATQPIPTDTNSPQSAAKFCSECGYRFSGTEKFCPECGARRS